jgi:hypothetical protein
MKSLEKLGLAALLVVVLTGTLFAGSGNRTGTGGASELLIPVGARDIGLGGATVATTSGLSSLFFNPAGITRSDRSVNLMFTHMSYIADIGVEYGAASATFEGLGTLALSIKSLSIGDIPVTTTTDPDGESGQFYSPQFFVAGLTYGRQLSDRVSVGVTGNLITERLGDVSASGVAFSAGVIYDNVGEVDGLSLGVAAKNIGPQMRFSGSGLYQLATVSTQNRPPQYYLVEAAGFELPSSIEIGVGYKMTFQEQNVVLLTTGFQNNNFSDDEYRVGVEYAYDKTLFLRVGDSFAPQTPSNSDYIYGISAGVGISYPLGDTHLTVDYAYRQADFFSGNHVIGVILGF